MKCDRCENEATIHITEIRRGLSHGRHLCEACAERVLRLEESDYSDYLDVLPPKDARFESDEGEPTKDELEMTGMREHVVVADLETGAVERAGLKTGDAFSPVWSPDGKRLALCHSLDLHPSILIVQPGTPGVRQYTHTTYGEPASWSRDSRRVVFSHIDDGACVAVAEADGELLYHLDAVGEEITDVHPAWSPLDERIAFAGMRMPDDDDHESEPMFCTVETTTAQGGPRRLVARLEEVLVIRLRWSPDARRLGAITIPYAARDSEDLFDGPAEQGLVVMLADVDEGMPRRLARCAIGFTWFERVAGFSDAPVVAAIEVPRRGASFRAVLFDPASRRRIEIPAELAFAGSALQPTHLSRDGKTLATVPANDPRRVVLLEPASVPMKSTQLDSKGEVCWLGFVPLSDDLALLVRDADSTRLDLLSPAGARRTVTRFDRREYFEAPSAALSPDGRRVAVELHRPLREPRA